MPKMNVTESNFLGILIAHGRVPKSKVSLGGRYHVALQGLCRLGYASLKAEGLDQVYVPTEEGIAALAETSRNETGTDARSKMVPVGTRRKTGGK